MLASLLLAQSSDSQELVLDHWRAPLFTAGDRMLLETFSALLSLSLNGCGLESLQDFPHLPHLRTLHLNDNYIADGLHFLQPLTALETLGLSANRISVYDVLHPLAALPRLQSLDLMECPLAGLPDYRPRVLAALPALTLLDRVPRDNLQVAPVDSDDESESLYELDSRDEDEDEQIEFANMLDEDNGNCVLIDATSSEEEEA